MVVFNIGVASWPVDQTSWGNVWQAAVAVNEMCVKESKTGTSVVRSKSKYPIPSVPSSSFSSHYLQAFLPAAIYSRGNDRLTSFLG